jgi:hypothetical protein
VRVPPKKVATETIGCTSLIVTNDLAVIDDKTVIHSLPSPLPQRNDHVRAAYRIWPSFPPPHH